MPAAPGSVRLADVAQAAGVSMATASRALLDQPRISAATRARVQQAANELGYVKDLRASNLKSGSNRAVGLIVRGAQLSYYGELIVAAQSHLARSGYSLIVANGMDQPDEHLAAMHDLKTMRVIGAIVSSGQVPTNDVEALATQMPVVVVGRGLRSPTVSSVAGDRSAVPRLVDAVCTAGHRRVGVLTVARTTSLTRSVRAVAMARELARRGVEVRQIPTGSDGVVPLADSLAEAVTKVTAIMCPNDPALIATWELLAEQGLKVPEDISLTGFDGIGQLSSPVLGLTTWVQDVGALGVAAARIMVAQLQTPGKAVHTRIAGHFVAGRTLGNQRQG